MMIADLLDEALKLPDQERAELVARLLDSLEDSDVVEPGHEAAWTEVIDRRVQRVRDGIARLVNDDATMARLRAIVGRVEQIDRGVIDETAWTEVIDRRVQGGRCASRDHITVTAGRTH